MTDPDINEQMDDDRRRSLAAALRLLQRRAEQTTDRELIEFALRGAES